MTTECMSEEEPPMFSIDLFRFDRFNLCFLMIIALLFGLILISTLGTYYFLIKGNKYWYFMLVLLPPLLYGPFGIVIPGTLSHKMKVYPDRLQEEFILFRTFKNRYYEHHDFYYDDLQIYPGRVFFFEGYVFKMLSIGFPRTVPYDLGIQIIQHIKKVVGEEKWQEIYRKE